MMQKIFTYLVICVTFFVVSSCKHDEAVGPPKASFTVNKTSGLAGDTEFTFTIPRVNAAAVSLLPYGVDHPNWGGVLVTFDKDATEAVVTFKYASVGTYNAVVVTNNHTGDGKSVKNTTSDSQAITISSGKNQITDFSFDKSTKTTIDQTAKTIVVIMPYGTDVTTLKAKFTADPATTITVNGVEQKNGSTVNIGTTTNNFSSPLVYTVKANNGVTNSYTVTVTVTPINIDPSFKSFSGKEISTAAKGKVIPASINSSTKEIVLYDVYGTPTDRFDSVRVQYALNNGFAVAHLGNGSGTGKLKQDSLLNLTTFKTLKVSAQDSATLTSLYKLYAVAAPKLELSTPTLVPQAISTTTDFGIELKVLKGTNRAALTIQTALTTPTGVTATIMAKPDGGTAVNVPNASPTVLNFTGNVIFTLTVVDTNIGVTYTEVYTAKATELN